MGGQRFEGGRFHRKDYHEQTKGRESMRFRARQALWVKCERLREGAAERPMKSSH